MRRITLAAFAMLGCATATAAESSSTANANANATEPPSTATTAATVTKPRERPLLLVLEPAGDVLAADQRTTIETTLELLLAERLDVDVQSSRGLRARVDLIAEKQLSGCDTSACSAEIAAALGARFVVFSRGAKLGSDTLLRIEVFDDTESRTLALTTVQANDDKALLARLPKAVGELIDEASGALPRRATTRALVETASLRGPSPWLVGGGITAAAGAVVALVGGVVVVLSSGTGEDTVSAAADAYAADPTLDNARAVREARIAATPGPLQPLGQSGIALGLTGLVVGAVVVGIDLLHAPAPSEDPQ
jgi:hypothetical protein